MEASRYIHSLREQFAITKTDKLTHNLSLVCVKLFRHKLYREITSPAYTRSDITFQDIMLSHQTFNRRFGYKHVDNLPYLHAVPKCHKIPKKLRFLAGISSSQVANPDPIQNINQNNNPNQNINQNINQNQQEDGLLGPVRAIWNRPTHKPKGSTTLASTKLSKYLRDVMKILELKDQAYYTMSGYRRYWIKLDGNTVFQDIKSNIALYRNKHPRTHDFTTMYTQLDHNRIRNNVLAAVNEAIEFKNRIANQHDHRLPTLPAYLVIQNHVNFIVDNSYIQNNDLLIHQTMGLPMGTNSAPESANLTLYYDEARYMDSLIERANNGDLETKALAKNLSFTSRFIDDMLTWNCLPPPENIYNLHYTDQTNEDGSVYFLGATIAHHPLTGNIYISVYDKSALWNFPVIKYPHADSNVPPHQIQGVIFSQLLSYRRICSTIHAFKKATTALIEHLLLRQHTVDCILKGWYKYLHKYRREPRTKALNPWFHKMLTWCHHHRRREREYYRPIRQQPFPNLQNNLNEDQVVNENPIVDENLAVNEYLAEQLIHQFEEMNNNPEIEPLSPLMPENQDVINNFDNLSPTQQDALTLDNLFQNQDFEPNLNDLLNPDIPIDNFFQNQDFEPNLNNFYEVNDPIDDIQLDLAELYHANLDIALIVENPLHLNPNNFNDDFVEPHPEIINTAVTINAPFERHQRLIITEPIQEELLMHAHHPNAPEHRDPHINLPSLMELCNRALNDENLEYVHGFIRKVLKNQGRRIHYPDPLQTPKQCPLCKQVFNTKQGFSKHQTFQNSKFGCYAVTRLQHYLRNQYNYPHHFDDNIIPPHQLGENEFRL